MEAVRYFFPKEVFNSLNRFTDKEVEIKEISDEDIKSVIRFSLSEQFFNGEPIPSMLIKEMENRKIKAESVMH